MSEKKNNHIELYRIIFTFVIIFHHYDGLKGNLHNGYLAVEFFFMVSGFFLMQNFVQKRNMKGNPWKYTLSRIKRLYPSYIMAFLLAGGTIFTMDCMKGTSNISIGNLVETIPEIFMMQGMGIFTSISLNFVGWYLSVLLLASFISYALLEYSQKLAINLIFPGVILLSYGYFYTVGLENWIHIGPFYLPIFRGLAGMMTGILTYKAYIWIVNNWKINNKLVWLIELTDVLLIIDVMFSEGQEQYYIILFPVLIICASINKNISSNSVVNNVIRYMGNKSYLLYINQVSVMLIFRYVARMFDRVGVYYILQMLMFVMVNIIVMFIFDKMINRIKKIVCKINNKFKIIERI